jgi:hypothetical protein
MLFASISNKFLFFDCLLHKCDISLHCALSLYSLMRLDFFFFSIMSVVFHVPNCQAMLLVLSFGIALISLMPHFDFRYA